MARELTIAEQCIDRQAKTEVFEGRQLDVSTGRVLLHALDIGGVPLCGHDHDQLTPIDRSWSDAYLPHLPRCELCMRAGLGELYDEQSRGASSHRPLAATGVDIRTAHGTETEAIAARALSEVLTAYDLRRWMFTDLVMIDESTRGGFSHPLTVSPALLTRRPALALTTFLHEQLHWLEGPDTDGLIAEARERWPEPPPPPAGGHSAQSTWLHMSVCALEYQSLSEIIGRPAARAEVHQHAGYSWIYEQIQAEPRWFSDYLQRHALKVPEHPPVPRRYFGDTWWPPT